MRTVERPSETCAPFSPPVVQLGCSPRPGEPASTPPRAHFTPCSAKCSGAKRVRDAAAPTHGLAGDSTTKGREMCLPPWARPTPLPFQEDRLAAWRPLEVGLRYPSRGEVCHRVAGKGAEG